MFFNVFLEFSNKAFIEAHSEHYLQISCPYTHMSKNIRKISPIDKDDCLDICGDLLLPIYLLTQQYSASLICLMHDLLKVLDSLDIATTPNGLSLAYNQPVAKVRTLSDLGVDFLDYHGEAEE